MVNVLRGGMGRITWRIVVTFLLVGTWMGSVPTGVKIAVAQSVSVSWGQPIILTDPKIQSWSPTITADSAGGVHILWSQSMLSGSPVGQGDTIYYTRWDGVKWSTPSDILVTPNGLGAEYPDVAVTPDGIIHAIWGTGGENSRLMYARAPVCCADDPRNWTNPVVLGTSVNQTSAIKVDSQGTLHIVYASLSEKKVIYLRSENSGQDWSDPVSLLSGTRRQDEYTAYPRVSVDERGRIHVVWSIMPYPGRAVMYSRSDDSGVTWKDPVPIDAYDRFRYEEEFGPYLIDVEAVGEDEVHLSWDGAPTVERHHVWSSDGGETWSDPDTFIPELTGGGRALWNDMEADSSGVLHAVSIKQPWAAQWNRGGWSQSVAIGQRSFAEDMRLAISNGNQLHVVWLEVIPGSPSVVYYVRGVSSSPAEKGKPLPALTTDMIENQLLVQPSATPQMAVVEVPDLSNPSQVSLDEINSPARGVFISAGVTSLLLVVLVFAAKRRNH
jgi:hypothetical protein